MLSTSFHDSLPGDLKAACSYCGAFNRCFLYADKGNQYYPYVEYCLAAQTENL